ncbi:hypothetical protein OU995_19090 [Roseateles sp. SL47]|uniref:hypothetical protein n=1 Tax=Roseateles sp. SL47 TaxID=2995138 RepID=UPI00226EAFF0|nr:hypothetical protein [Roseateles sp. SL47]WAC71675.1 hypothetical protein OU995_19090 [Roseateles sp. SL47]
MTAAVQPPQGDSSSSAKARLLLVLGNWRLRHAEPVPESVQDLQLVPLPAGARLGARAAQMDCRCSLPLLATLGPQDWRTSGSDVRLNVANLDVERMPLAIVRLAGATLEDGLLLQALVDRTDLHGAHFLALPPGGPVIAPQTFWHQLAEAFNTHHLLTNNYECFYTSTAAPPPWRLVLNPPAPDVWQMGEDWLDDLTTSPPEAVFGFVPQLGEEWQFVRHDNVACEVLRVPEGPTGTVNAALFSVKRKAQVLDRWAQVTASLTGLPGMSPSPAWRDVPLTASAQEHMAGCLELPLHESLHWRRTAFVGHCESLSSGHLLKVSFSLNQSLEAPRDTIALCGIDYLKTRGLEGARSPKQDVQDLANLLTGFLKRRGGSVVPSSQRPFPPPARRLCAAAFL